MQAFLIVILGGIASGKSRVSKLFAELGGQVLNADDMVHELFREEAVQQRLRELFGDSVIQNQPSPPSVDRKALGQIVFENPERLKELEQVMHPLVRQKIQGHIARAVEQAQAKSQAQPQLRPVIVLDVPLAAEGGYCDNADLVVYVDVPEDVRIHRAITTRGWTADELRRRESLQMPIAEKKALARFRVNNNQSLEKTQNDVRRIWNQAIRPQLS